MKNTFLVLIEDILVGTRVLGMVVDKLLAVEVSVDIQRGTRELDKDLGIRMAVLQ